MDELDSLATAIHDAAGTSGSLLVLTGAGISAASGIPTFRGPEPDAVWSRDVTEIATERFFRRDPVTSWRWYLDRFGSLVAAAPNAAHTALVELETALAARGAGFLLVTQNIDGLHRRAGSRALVEVHGRADRLRCARYGCIHGAPSGSIPRDPTALAAFAASPGPATLPRCAACDDLLRPHVLWFDELYADHHDYGFDRLEEALETATVVLAIGTSFAVGVTEVVLGRARWNGVPVWSIDPHGTTRAGIRQLPLAAESALPELVSRLRASA